MAPPNLQITLGHPHERAGDIMASGKKATLLVANPSKRGCVAWLAWRNPPDGFNSAQQFLQACQAELHSVPWQVNEGIDPVAFSELVLGLVPREPPSQSVAAVCCIDREHFSRVRKDSRRVTRAYHSSLQQAIFLLTQALSGHRNVGEGVQTLTLHAMSQPLTLSGEHSGEGSRDDHALERAKVLFPALLNDLAVATGVARADALLAAAYLAGIKMKPPHIVPRTAAGGGKAGGRSREGGGKRRRGGQRFPGEPQFAANSSSESSSEEEEEGEVVEERPRKRAHPQPHPQQARRHGGGAAVAAAAAAAAAEGPALPWGRPMGGGTAQQAPPGGRSAQNQQTATAGRPAREHGQAGPGPSAHVLPAVPTALGAAHTWPSGRRPPMRGRGAVHLPVAHASDEEGQEEDQQHLQQQQHQRSDPRLEQAQRGLQQETPPRRAVQAPAAHAGARANRALLAAAAERRLAQQQQLQRQPPQQPQQQQPPPPPQQQQPQQQQQHPQQPQQPQQEGGGASDGRDDVIDLC